MAKIDIEKTMMRKGSGYPDPFRQMAKTRIKRALGDAGGLTQFGVNLVTLPAGEWSSQRHWHSHEEEFIYVISGELTLITDAGEETFRAGECAAFPKGLADGHHMINKGTMEAVYLEVGSRDAADVISYPDIDLHYASKRYLHKDGTPY
ncbi:MAG: cupin domain-containing protein [Hyphomonadaceae bacterium]